MTSGKPGQRGYHGIGNNKPNYGASNAIDDDDLDDMLDAVGGPARGVDPLTAINQKKAQK